MSGPMPYYLEKGPTLEVIEDFINSGGQRLIDAVELLRKKDANGRYVHRFVETGVFDTRALYFRQSAAESRTGNQVDWTPGEWRHHMDCHWFGIEDENRNRVDPAAVPNYAGAASWWINFWGDNVQDIMRETVLRAIECAYGVKHGDPLTSATRTPWPVEFFWKCGQAWFEGWVTWKRATPSGSVGQVTALLCTPSENSGTHYVWDSPIPDPSDAVGTSDPYNRTDHLGLEHAGMVVVTHTTNTPVGMAPNQIAMQQSGGLVPPLPGAAFHGQGPIVAVRPAEFRGGVGSSPRAWIPPNLVAKKAPRKKVAAKKAAVKKAPPPKKAAGPVKKAAARKHP